MTRNYTPAMSTLICTPILVHDEAAALRDALAAKDSGADLVEFRIDEYFPGTGDDQEQEAILRLVAESPLPCIVTCRPAAGGEGGTYEGDESARIALFERLAMSLGAGERPPRYLDVELASYSDPAVRQRLLAAMDHPERTGDLRTSLILSSHDFEGRPADLTRRILRMHHRPEAGILKIAFRARSLRDNLELFDLLAQRDRPMIALGMGEFGLMSRVLAPKFGGFLTFASLRPTTTTAPGQPTVRDLLNLYRFRSIGPATAVYGVVGYPIGHSISPRVHNAGFESIGHDGVYLPLPIIEGYESFKATVGELLDYPNLNLRGLSVTIPHKENLVRLAGESGWALDPVAAAVGAANTLAVDRDASGQITGVRVLNTDVPALVDSLKQELGDLKGQSAAVVGAGGVGRAAAYGLAAAGARVTVYNRSFDRAKQAAKALAEFGSIVAADLAVLPASRHDAYINCTPLGMAGGPGPDISAIPTGTLGSLSPGAVVLDTVYNPEDTPLLLAARKAGLRAAGGVSMFVRQAAAQFSVWTGTPAPSGLFAQVAREALQDPAG